MLLHQNPNVIGNNKTTSEESSTHNTSPTVHTNTSAARGGSYGALHPQFTNNQATSTQEAVEQNTLWQVLQEYAALEKSIRAAMSFQEYSNIRYRNRPRGQPDSVITWVQKLDTYFRLNHMMEVDAIQFATLYLKGEAHDWWYRSLVMLGHANITSYADPTLSVPLINGFG